MEYLNKNTIRKVIQIAYLILLLALAINLIQLVYNYVLLSDYKDIYEYRFYSKYEEHWYDIKNLYTKGLIFYIIGFLTIITLFITDCKNKLVNNKIYNLIMWGIITVMIVLLIIVIFKFNSNIPYYELYLSSGDRMALDIYQFEFATRIQSFFMTPVIYVFLALIANIYLKISNKSKETNKISE